MGGVQSKEHSADHSFSWRLESIKRELATRTIRGSMSPPEDATQTPEQKGSSGLASVFKSFAGGNKLLKSPHSQSPAAISRQLNSANTLNNAIYVGPPNYEQLFEQLKPGNPLIERLAAAEALRHAVQDYPLSGVSWVER